MLYRSSLVRRADGTFVGDVNGMPYHIIPGDQYWDETQEEASLRALPSEPVFEPPEPPPPQPVVQPTRAELMARLEQIAAQIVALEKDAP